MWRCAWAASAIGNTESTTGVIIPASISGHTRARTAAAIEASGAEIVTVAVRRVNVTDPGQPMLVDYLDPKLYTYIPNTAGCFTAAEAVRTLRLALANPL